MFSALVSMLLQQHNHQHMNHSFTKDSVETGTSQVSRTRLESIELEVLLDPDGGQMEGWREGSIDV